MIMIKLRDLEGKFGFKPVVIVTEKVSTIFHSNLTFYFTLAYLSSQYH